MAEVHHIHHEGTEVADTGIAMLVFTIIAILAVAAFAFFAFNGTFFQTAPADTNDLNIQGTVEAPNLTPETNQGTTTTPQY